MIFKTAPFAQGQAPTRPRFEPRLVVLCLLILTLFSLPLGLLLDQDPARSQGLTRQELQALPVLAGIRENLRSALEGLLAAPPMAALDAGRWRQIAAQQSAAAKILGYTSALILDPELHIYHWAYLTTVKLPERMALSADLAALDLARGADSGRRSYLRTSLAEAWVEETRALGLALGDASDPDSDTLWRQNQARLQRLDGNAEPRADLRNQVRNDLQFWELGQERMEALLLARDQALSRERRLRWALLALLDLLAMIGAVLLVKRLRHRAASENEQRFRYLVEHASDALLLMGSDGKVPYASPSMANVLGFSPQEREGVHADQWLHPEDRPHLAEILKRCLADPGKVYAFETRMLHKDGRWIRVAAKLRNLIQVPAVGALVLNYHDISAEHEAGQALGRSEGLFRALVEQSGETTLLIGANMAIKYVTPNAGSFTGYGPTERLGDSVGALTHPDDVGLVRSEFARLLKAPGETAALSYRTRHKEGHWVTIEATVSNRLNDPTIDALVVTCRNITARRATEAALKESEEYHRALIENAHDIVAIYRTDGTLSYENPKALEALGYEADDLATLAAYTLVHPEDLAEFMRQENARDGQAESGESTLRLKTKDGRWLEFEARARKLSDKIAIRGILLQLRDVSEAHATQRRLLKLERLAAIGQTAAGLAHEVRNPLAIITGRAEFLRSQLTDRAALLPDLDSILAQSDRLRDLVRDLLERSKSQAPDLVRGLAKDLMERSLKAAQTRYGAAGDGVDVIRDYCMPPLELFVDPAQMERVLTNLILNALQAMRGGGALTVATRRDGTDVVLEVADNGEGIPPGNLARVFEPFFTTKDTGSGLGLWICRGIVEEHGGRLEAANLTPRGCVFRIILPSTPGKKP